ncbi:MAG: hypothetical protein KAF91_29140 [Nostoc sp. TH1S01]|nr:hypothetical protein [Nostoc sp. TH1S01]
MSKLSIFEALLQDNAELFTTQGLSSLLEDCIWLGYPKRRHIFTYPSLLDRSIYLALADLGNSNAEDEEIIRRILADPKGWCLDASETVQEGAQFYDSMGKMFGTNFGTNLFLYHRVRDNIQELQKRLGVSGVSPRNISIRDRLFTYPAPEDQLMLLECDACGNVKDERATLQNAVPEIVKYFLEIVQMSPIYNLFFVDEDEKKIPTSVAIVEDAAARAVKAEIYSESYNWKPTNTNCWEGKPAPQLHPDEIHLILHLDWDENKFMFFDAHHPDINRWPWLIEN